MAEFTYDDLERFSNNPNRAISKIYDLIESNINSDVVGGFNGTVDPFTYCIDAILGSNHIFLDKLSDAVSSGYLIHARNIADLAKHMSDDDWVGVFAEPSETTLRFLIPINEIERVAIPYEEFDNELLNFYSKLIIPKDTIVKVVDTDFWLEHAVEIRVMEHGGIQVLYDTTQTSPFKTLGTNYPEREFINLNGNRFLCIYLPVRQVAIKEIPNKSSNSAVGFSTIYSYDDKLYKIRAFIQYWGENYRREMTVIFNRNTYDINYPTLTVDLLDNNQFRASIPTVYLENGLGLGDVTLLVYTTKGQCERDIVELSQNYYRPAYYNYTNSKGVLSEFEEPFKTLDDVLINSHSSITGGDNGRTFEEIKRTMVYAHRLRDIPISPVDLKERFLKAGYSTIKSIDYPNERLYRVTKPLPEQNAKKYDTESLVPFNSSIGVFVGSVLTSLNELNALGVGKLNGKRYTIFPGTVIEVLEDKTVLWSKNDTDALKNSSAQNKIDFTSNRTLSTNGFYYVLDTTNDQARLRPYYMDEPSIVEQTFFYENPYLGISVGVSKDGVAISKKADGSGYYIEIVTTSSDAYKQIDDSKLGVQISFDVNNGEGRKTARGYLVGKNSNGERKWGFNLVTDFDIDHEHQLYFKGFRQFGMSQDTVSAKLNQATSFIFTYEGDSTREKSTADIKIDQTLYETQATAIVETEFNIEFGRYLENLYYAIRPMVGYQQYQTYTQDIAQTYPENTYQYKDGKMVIVNGKAVIEHRKGEVMKDSKGQAILLHRKGDTVKDSKGNPVPVGERDIKYYWDFVGFDYAYTLSQDDYDIDYYTQIKHRIGISVMDEIKRLTTNMLERTQVLYKPRSTIGATKVIINESQEIDIKNDLQFTVAYYLTDKGSKDKNVKSLLRSNTHKLINSHLKSNTISKSGIISLLKPNDLEDVVDVKVTIYSGERIIDVITNVDSTNGFAVKKKLVLTGDNFLTVEEDIDISFRTHKLKQ